MYSRAFSSSGVICKKGTRTRVCALLCLSVLARSFHLQKGNKNLCVLHVVCIVISDRDVNTIPCGREIKHRAFFMHGTLERETKLVESLLNRIFAAIPLKGCPHGDLPVKGQSGSCSNVPACCCGLWPSSAQRRGRLERSALSAGETENTAVR